MFKLYSKYRLSLYGGVMEHIRKSAIFNTTEQRWDALQKIAKKHRKTVPEYLMSLVEEKNGETLRKLEAAFVQAEEVLGAEKQAG